MVVHFICICVAGLLSSLPHILLFPSTDGSTVLRCLILTATRLFLHIFGWAHSRSISNAPNYWAFCGESIDDPCNLWAFHSKGQQCGKSSTPWCHNAFSIAWLLSCLIYMYTTLKILQTMRLTVKCTKTFSIQQKCITENISNFAWVRRIYCMMIYRQNAEVWPFKYSVSGKPGRVFDLPRSKNKRWINNFSNNLSMLDIFNISWLVQHTKMCSVFIKCCLDRINHSVCRTLFVVSRTLYPM